MMKIVCVINWFLRACKTILAVSLIQLNHTVLLAQKISNVDFYTQGEAIVITYDLHGCAAGEKQDIQVHFEYRNGKALTPLSILGDYKNVPCGSGKRIIWKVKDDLEELRGEFMVVLSFAPKFKTVQIGTQVWMAENLDVSTFRNGDLIPEAKSAEEWQRAGQNRQPAWCYYDNNPANGATYGKLYNWFAVTDQRDICPIGWVVPSDEKWIVLTKYLGSDVGIKMKSTKGWLSNGNGNNVSGFSGLPGGSRNDYGTFDNIGDFGGWWSSTESGQSRAWGRQLNSRDDYVYGNLYDMFYGFSVRCINEY